MSIKNAVRQIEKELLEHYRYYFQGNRSAPDGRDIRVAITELEQEMKELKAHESH